MKKILLVTASLIAISATAPAFGADLAARNARTYTKAPMMNPAYDWSGFYIGLNGGGGTSHDCWSALGSGMGCNNGNGGTVGGQIGYRWQTGPVVFGVEAQGNWANLNGSNTNLLNTTLSDNNSLNAFGLFTGQVGYAWNNVLLYVKGGAAVVNNKYSVTQAGALVTSFSGTNWGETVGVGLEYGFTPNWSFGVEYDHIFLGSQNVNINSPAGVTLVTGSISQNADIFTARLNYKFGGPVVAKY